MFYFNGLSNSHRHWVAGALLTDSSHGPGVTSRYSTSEPDDRLHIVHRYETECLGHGLRQMQDSRS